MPHRVDRDQNDTKKVKSNLLTPGAVGVVAAGARGAGRSNGDGEESKRRTGEEHGCKQCKVAEV